MKPDQKPQLSRAAIECNIEYYSSLEDKHKQAFLDAQIQHSYWLLKLRELANDHNL